MPHQLPRESTARNVLYWIYKKDVDADDEEEFESEVIHVDEVPGLFPIQIQENAEAEIQTVGLDKVPEQVNLENVMIENQNLVKNVLETTTNSGKN